MAFILCLALWLSNGMGGLHVTSLLQVALESRELSQAEKFCKAEQIHKMTLKIVLDEQSCHFE